jgi:hypothetical protein
MGSLYTILHNSYLCGDSCRISAESRPNRVSHALSQEVVSDSGTLTALVRVENFQPHAFDPNQGTEFAHMHDLIDGSQV